MDWKQAYSVGMPEMDAQHQTAATCVALARDRRDNAAALAGRAPGLLTVHAFAQVEMTTRSLSN